MAFGGEHAQNAAHRGQEAHVEHAIRFVDHEKRDVVERGGFLREMIEQTAGRRDDDVGAAFERRGLLTEADAAVDGRDFDVRVLREGREVQR